MPSRDAECFCGACSREQPQWRFACMGRQREASGKSIGASRVRRRQPHAYLRSAELVADISNRRANRASKKQPTSIPQSENVARDSPCRCGRSARHRRFCYYPGTGQPKNSNVSLTGTVPCVAPSPPKSQRRLLREYQVWFAEGGPFDGTLPPLRSWFASLPPVL